MAARPDILFFHVDNLGPGELTCYSGGPFRGAQTQRIDALAEDGLRLTNYCPESRCTPTRSALLTGRHTIRSGTHSVPIGTSSGWGLVAWEKTLGELLTDAGYACAVYSSWQVGEGPGRWEATAALRSAMGRRAATTRRCGSPTPGATPTAHMLKAKRGDPDVTEGDQLTLEREPVSLPHLHTWTTLHTNRIIGEFEASIQREPLLPMGVPLDHLPAPPTP